MKLQLALILSSVLSLQAFASIECENKLVEHFTKEGIDTTTMNKTQDYTHPHQKVLNKKAYSTSSVYEFTKLISEAKKYIVKDSRGNEAIRVCTTIAALARAGLSSKEIEEKTLDFQNGWTEAMRAPVAELIKNELAALGIDGSKNIASSDKLLCSLNVNESNCSTLDGKIYKLQVENKKRSPASSR